MPGSSRARFGLLLLIGSIVSACGTATPPSGSVIASQSRPASAASSGSQGKQPISSEEVAALPPGPERQKLLEEGARREGQLMLFTTAVDMTPVVKAFTAKYPFIKLEFTPARGDALAQRVLAEARSGKLSGDLLQTDLGIYRLVEDLLVKIEAPGAKFDVPKSSTLFYTAIGFTYSKQRVSADLIPAKVEDLLLPRWKGNIGLYAPPNNYPGRWVGTLLATLGDEQTKSFLSKLGDQKPSFYSDPQPGRNMLLSGDVDINMQGLSGRQQQLPPIGWAALDPTNLSPNTIGLFKLAAHPNAAMLFVDWALTTEGLNSFADSQGTITAEDLQKHDKDGIKLPQRVNIEGPDTMQGVAGWTRLFEQLVMKK